jgi:hypothetical protein
MNRRATATQVLLASLAVTAMAAVPAFVAPAPARGPAAAASGDKSAFGVKAAFLYNFAFFTIFPDDAFPTADAPIVVGVVGADPFGATLDATLKDKKVGTHPIVVERYANAEKIGKPHVLYAGGHDDDKLAAVRIACRDRAIVLVGDCPGFCARGGIANFFIEESKVRFEMNPGAAKRARLQPSSQLLKLAKIVEGP